MTSEYTFKFLDDRLNRRLIASLRKKNITHRVDDNGVIHYLPEAEDTVGNNLIPAIRNTVFKPWQILTCPEDWVWTYKDYMKSHSIPFEQELIDNELWFLIPRCYRPHLWRLDKR